MTTETLAPVATETPAATPAQVAAPNETTAAQADVSTQVQDETVTLKKSELSQRIEHEKTKALRIAERLSLRREREMLERFIPQPAAQAQSQDSPPARDKFATDEQWLDARDEWRDAKRDRADREKREAESHKATASKTEKIYEAASKLPGFDRDTFEDLPLTPVIAQTIIDSEIAAQLMAHMSANPDDVERISKLSPARQAAEIGRLEAKLSVIQVEKKAPAPLKTISASGTVSLGKLSEASNYDDFVKLRARQIAARRR